ncbi:phosphosulfolactate synthase [Alicyclobacillus cellulosilyticus]|uniref:Phosphosulfolactate synthase n=1 Tax=Alicyclobacillus cellulosilyticus TaxID=1003997 RepID=A0A917KCX8_9BACL|nr:phosphosulfolactate synthase [Alicyclobacillus cellulosilyticus]GGJ05894.1 phosphosulfolactate synthase [Alicyclobacillus cellulosilyticus]
MTAQPVPTHPLQLPPRDAKPRTRGITILIDNGVPTSHFTDVIQSHHPYIDFVKFGWGTAIVTLQLADKIRCLRDHGVEFFFGGTLFEKFLLQDRVEAYIDFCRAHDCRYVEVSNGTIDLDNTQKAEYIARLAHHFTVFSEVGYKDSERSLNLHPARWIEYMRQDLAAGAAKVITEARESGTSGICRADGEVRYGLIEEIIESGIPLDQIVFEAPNKTLQTYFIKRVGPQVNLANVPFDDAIALETLRLGLRSDTLTLFDPAASK